MGYKILVITTLASYFNHVYIKGIIIILINSFYMALV